MIHDYWCCFQKQFVDYDNFDIDAHIEAQVDIDIVSINASFTLNITEKEALSRNTTDIEVNAFILSTTVYKILELFR